MTTNLKIKLLKTVKGQQFNKNSFLGLVIKYNQLLKSKLLKNSLVLNFSSCISKTF